jgi:hypothetical protein
MMKKKKKLYLKEDSFVYWIKKDVEMQEQIAQIDLRSLRLNL